MESSPLVSFTLDDVIRVAHTSSFVCDFSLEPVVLSPRKSGVMQPMYIRPVAQFLFEVHGLRPTPVPALFAQVPRGDKLYSLSFEREQEAFVHSLHSFSQVRSVGSKNNSLLYACPVLSEQKLVTALAEFSQGVRAAVYARKA